MNTLDDDVILVDLEDQEIGRAAKLPAHKCGLLHRAISVCVLDDSGRMLLQRRAVGKYHSGGLWTNACCTHPHPGEAVEDAAARRLREELGLTCPLRFVARTHYEAPVGRLWENEVVHIFLGHYDGEVNPNPEEVEAVAWTPREALLADIARNPEDYSYWFRLYVAQFSDELFASGASRSPVFRPS